MNIRRIALIFLATLFLSVSFAHVASAQEETVEELTAQISSLLELVADLQAQIALLQGQSAGQSAAEMSATVQFTAQFNRNLRLGDRGEDVKNLQKVLNSDTRTRVVAVGGGSSGRETTYFGALTHAAVIKFQELYRNEVLAPVGLSEGTGYVGASTRAKLNNISSPSAGASSSSGSGASTYVPPTTSQPSTLPPNLTLPTDPTTGLPTLTPTQTSSLFISTASVREGAPGDTLIINGGGFESAGNIVYFGAQKTSGVPSQNGTSLTFIIPQYIQTGFYTLRVTNSSGEEALGNIDFVVKRKGAQSPVIYTVSPAIGPYGSAVTIYGSGFTSFTNRVEIGGTVVGNVSVVDNKQLKITIAPDELAELAMPSAGSQATGPREWPVYITVSNENGISAEPGVFIIRQ